MTAPVQMDYDFSSGKKTKIMSFLYQNTNVGKPGAAEDQVLVSDRPAVTVISVAIGGESGDGMMDSGVGLLMQVLESQQIWAICG